MPTDMTRDELKQAIDNNELDYVFDARGHDDYNKEHIVGAESLPAGDVERGVGLPEEKGAKIAFYCTNPN